MTKNIVLVGFLFLVSNAIAQRIKVNFYTLNALKGGGGYDGNQDENAFKLWIDGNYVFGYNENVCVECTLSRLVPCQTRGCIPARENYIGYGETACKCISGGRRAPTCPPCLRRENIFKNDACRKADGDPPIAFRFFDLHNNPVLATYTTQDPNGDGRFSYELQAWENDDISDDCENDNDDDGGPNPNNEDAQGPLIADLIYSNYKPQRTHEIEPTRSKTDIAGSWSVTFNFRWEPNQYNSVSPIRTGYVCGGDTITLIANASGFLNSLITAALNPVRDRVKTQWQFFDDPFTTTPFFTTIVMGNTYKYTAPIYNDLRNITVKATPVIDDVICTPDNVFYNSNYGTGVGIVSISPPRPTHIDVISTPTQCNGSQDGYLTFGKIYSNFIPDGQDVYVNFRNLNAGGTIIKKKNELNITSYSQPNGRYLPAGTYEVQTYIATTSSGCSFIKNVTVNEPAPLNISINSITGISRVHGLDASSYSGTFNISCTGLNNAWLKFDASGGNTPYRFSVTSSTLVTTDSPTLQSTSNFTFTNLKPDTYTYSVADKNNCPINRVNGSPASIPVTEPPKLQFVNSALGVSVYPIASGLNYNVRCFGINDGWMYNQGVGGVFPYQFILMDSTSKLPIQNASTIVAGYTFYTLSCTNYGVKLHDANGCKDTIYKTLLQPTPLTIPLVSPQGAICSGATDGKLFTQAAGGVVERTYNYYIYGNTNSGGFQDILSKENPSITTTSINTFLGLSAGMYTLTVTDVNGCSTLTSFVITEPGAINVPVSSIPNQLVCKGDANGVLAANPTGGTPPFQYVWYKGSLKDFSPTSLSVYTILGTSSWLTGLRASEYTVFVKDARGCSKNNSGGFPDPNSSGVSAVFAINEPTTALSYTANIQSTECFGSSNGRVTLTPNGGWGGYRYLQNNVFSSTNVYQNLAAGQYQFTYKDSEGCVSVTSPITITEPAPIQVNARYKDITCNGLANGYVVLTLSGGTRPYQISLDNSTFSSYPQVSVLGVGMVATISGLAPNSYAVGVKDNNLCLSTITTFTISEPGALEGNISTTPAICGSATGTALVEILGGTNPITVRWLAFGENTVTGANILSISGLHANLYRAVLADAQNCVITIAGVVNNHKGPEFNVAVNTRPSCSSSADGSVQLFLNETESSAPIQSYLWTDRTGSVITTTVTASNLSSGIYTASLRDTDGCLKSKQINLTAPNKLGMAFSSTNPSCFNHADGKINTSVTGGTGTLIFEAFSNDKILSAGTGRTFETKNLMANDASNAIINYQINAKDQNGCTISGIRSLQNPPLMTIELGKDSAVICTGQSYDLDAGNAGSIFEWKQNGNYITNTQTIAATEAGTYTIKATSKKGCEATKSFKLRSSERALVASFLLSQEVYVGDTLVIAEVSKPEPDSVSWAAVPKGLVLTRLPNQAPQHLAIIVQDTGRYSFELTAKMGKCTDNLTKTIMVKPAKNKPKELRLGYKGIKKYEATPNPTTGTLHIEVLLTDVQPITVEIYAVIGSGALFSQTYENKSLYQETLSLDSYASGLYFVIFKSSTSTKMLRVVKY